MNANRPTPSLVIVALAALVPLAAPDGALAARVPEAAPAAQAPDTTEEQEDAGPRSFRVHRAEGEIRVDGRLEEPAWDRARVVRLPWEWSPARNEPAPVETECRLAYDADHLYLGCLARDPEPSAIRAHLADRDEPFQDDHITLLLDTFGDRRRAFQFRVNPLGIQMDALMSDNGENFSWDAIWDSEGRITDEGYVVEVALPFRSLKFPETAGSQSWGLILGRSYPRSVRHRLRSIETDFSDACLLCQADRVTGLRDVSSGHGVELNPTLTTRRSDERDSLTASGLSKGAVDVDPGFTGQWGLTSNFNLSVTANPDFSQVEADVARLETNRRFTLRFPEKRPFFLEGSDFLQTPAPLVFTRQVVDPQAGVKLTGKTGGNSLGFFVARDEVTSIIFPGSQSSSRALLPEEVTTGVLRYQRDVGDASSVGLLLTDREGPGYHNRVLTVDGMVRLSPSTRLIFQAGPSSTDYPDSVANEFGQPAEAFRGFAMTVGVNHRTRDWFGFLGYNDVGSDFRTDAGFLPQVDWRQLQGSLRRNFWMPDAGWATRLALEVDGNYTEQHDGALLGRAASVEALYEGPLQSRVGLEAGWREENFRGQLFTLPRQELSLRLQPTGALEAGVRLERGKAIDFVEGRRADQLRVGPQLQWKAGRHLRLRLSHDLERLEKDGSELFTAHLSQSRLVYYFSPEAFLRAIVQYRNVSMNPAMYEASVPPEREQVFGQFLFSYKVNPRTVLFTGYTDTRRATDEVSLTQTDRTFFLKLGYALRL